MRGLVLVAASGLAREVLTALGPTGAFGEVCVVDDDPARWGEQVAGAPVVGGLDAVTGMRDRQVLVCAGRGITRRAIVARLTGLGVGPCRYATVVHDRVVVPGSCAVGPGSILLEGVVMTADVRVGSHVVVMPQVTLTHDDVVEDYATLCAGVALGGGVTVGEAAYLGMNSSVREGLSVGAGATLGMGAALVGCLPPGATWVGVPARSVAREQEVAIR